MAGGDWTAPRAGQSLVTMVDNNGLSGSMLAALGARGPNGHMRARVPGDVGTEGVAGARDAGGGEDTDHDGHSVYSTTNTSTNPEVPAAPAPPPPRNPSPDKQLLSIPNKASGLNSTSKARTKAAIAIQAFGRGMLGRLHTQRVKRNRQILLRRKDIMVDLYRATSHRRSVAWSWGYFVLVALFTACCFAGLDSSTAYDSIGFVKDTMASNQWANNESVWSVRSPDNFWNFVKNSVIGGVVTSSSSGTRVMYYYGYRLEALDHAAIIFRQGRSRLCRELYTPYTNIDFGGGYCATSIDSDQDTTRSGGSGTVAASYVNWAWDFANADYATFSDANSGDCPYVEYTTTGSMHEGYLISLPTELTTTDWTTIVDSAIRCNVFNENTQRVTVELACHIGNEANNIGFIVFEFKISNGGGAWAIYGKTFLVNVSVGSNNPYRKVELPLYIVAMVLSVIGIVLSLLDMVATVVIHRDMGLVRWVWDPWNSLNIAVYSLVVVSCSMWFYLDSQIQDMSNSFSTTGNTQEGWRVFRNSFREIIRFQNPTIIVVGVSLFCIYMRLLYTFRHYGMLSMLSKSVETVFVQLAHLTVALMVVYTGFALAAHTVFGRFVFELSTVFKTFVYLFDATLGDFDYAALARYDRNAAIIFHFSFMLVCALVLTNFFIAIVLDGYAAVANRIDVRTPTHELILQDVVSIQHEGVGDRVVSDEVLFLLRSVLPNKKTFTLDDFKILLHKPLAPEVCRIMLEHATIPGSARDVVDMDYIRAPYLSAYQTRSEFRTIPFVRWPWLFGPGRLICLHGWSLGYRALRKAKAMRCCRCLVERKRRATKSDSVHVVPSDMDGEGV